jgi:hypothetical protein
VKLYGVPAEKFFAIILEEQTRLLESRLKQKLGIKG